MDKNELLFEALKVIKETCSRRTNCKDCPLAHFNRECGIQETAPESWNINEPPKPSTYRAFAERKEDKQDDRK